MRLIFTFSFALENDLHLSLNEENVLLFGPVDVREFLDLSCSKTYVITLCSSKLLETRSNLFFLNLKSCGQEDSGAKLKYPTTSYSNNSLQKLHITIRKYKRTGLPNETIERGLMLLNQSFFSNLLESTTSSTSPEFQIKSLDLLNWIFYNHFSIDSDLLADLVHTFRKHLSTFLTTFFLHGERSTSRKASLLLNFLLKNVDRDKQFVSMLLESLLGLLGQMPNFGSSASLNWYFMLIHQVMFVDSNKTYQSCMSMLTQLSRSHRYNPFYALLKMRYNFGCLFFESQLFDIDLYFKLEGIKGVKSIASTGNPYTISFGSVGVSLGANQLNNQMISGSNLMSQSLGTSVGNTATSSDEGSGLAQSRVDPISSFTPSVGLLEVLPLSFKCISSTNGTSVEKTNNKKENSLYVLPDCFTFFEAQETHQSSSQTPHAIDFSIFNSIFSIQPQQFLVVERMEPVSRHFVVIDFGFPVALTDIMIPACTELSSLSFDHWMFKEQKDSKRLTVSTTIGNNPLLLNDLQPPIVCRYIKLIFVSQSSNIVKAKIPIGHYFGFPYIFYNDALQSTSDMALPNVYKTPALATGYLSYLEKLYEDNKCHYSMSVGKLRELLNQIQFPSDNIGHLKMMQFSINEPGGELSTRIKEAYNECLDYQFQLNLNSHLIQRLQSATGVDKKRPKESMTQDKLRVSNGLLIKTLLCLTYQTAAEPKHLLDLDTACDLFRDLCVYGSLEREASWLLLRCCHTEPWWGKFIANCLRSFFVNQVREVVHLSRIFITLNEICLKSLNGAQTNNLFKCLFDLLEVCTVFFFFT